MPDTPTVLLIGTLDTKGFEYAYLRDRLQADGVNVLVVDVGINDPNGISPDVTRHEVAASIGADANSLAAASDRGRAVATMTEAAARDRPQALSRRALRWHPGCRGLGWNRNRHPCHAGAAGGRSQADALDDGIGGHLELRGEHRHHDDGVDHRHRRGQLDLRTDPRQRRGSHGRDGQGAAGRTRRARRPLVGSHDVRCHHAGVTAARTGLEERGYEVLVFHCTGTGGRAMENLIEAGFFDGVLDLTTTELCDELVGGVLSAGPDRMGAAARTGVPQVVSLGALDMVNFGAARHGARQVRGSHHVRAQPIGDADADDTRRNAPNWAVRSPRSSLRPPARRPSSSR